LSFISEMTQHSPCPSNECLPGGHLDGAADATADVDVCVARFARLVCADGACSFVDMAGASRVHANYAVSSSSHLSLVLEVYAPTSPGQMRAAQVRSASTVSLPSRSPFSIDGCLLRLLCGRSAIDSCPYNNREQDPYRNSESGTLLAGLTQEGSDTACAFLRK
jgi:hypothetical protein